MRYRSEDGCLRGLTLRIISKMYLKPYKNFPCPWFLVSLAPEYLVRPSIGNMLCGPCNKYHKFDFDDYFQQIMIF